MQSAFLPLSTTTLKVDNSSLYWPEGINRDTYMLVYEHDQLRIEPSLQSLNTDKLYEAWAFDGNRSWHIWQKDDDWVCTEFNPSLLAEEDKMELEHFLASHIRRKLNKDKLVVMQAFGWDKDGQAYIAYSCPIRFV